VAETIAFVLFPRADGCPTLSAPFEGWDATLHSSEKPRSKQKAPNPCGLRPSLSCALREAIYRGGILSLGGTPFLAESAKAGVAKQGRSL